MFKDRLHDDLSFHCHHAPTPLSLVIADEAEVTAVAATRTQKLGWWVKSDAMFQRRHKTNNEARVGKGRGLPYKGMQVPR